MNIPNEACDAIHRAYLGADDDQLDDAASGAEIAASHIQAPLLARIAELEAKLAESERLAGVLREQRNKAEDELRGRA